ncbi:hypothetical protein K402DRAFT_394837 [Aulographum hederae CBS 113979]|uniref:Uncharacterized protein n=1 Tax=Aulographum hederae CBS 113979 TaxID=1176131 RepID=A0A6G1GX23_9PEZI|nr:hypothetical protein K402DRAFT_394837 [Aulographum hederae CBS 113979]
MAAPIPPSRPPATSPILPPTSNFSSRPLPDGECNYRDLSVGANAPSCGCKSFWCDGRLDENQQHVQRLRNRDTPWCMCGHHACFHAYAHPQASAASSHAQQLLRDRAPVHVYLSSSGRDTCFQLVAGSQAVSLQELKKAVAEQQSLTASPPNERPSHEQPRDAAPSVRASHAMGSFAAAQQVEFGTRLPQSTPSFGGNVGGDSPNGLGLAGDGFNFDSDRFRPSPTPTVPYEYPTSSQMPLAHCEATRASLGPGPAHDTAMKHRMLNDRQMLPQLNTYHGMSNSNNNQDILMQSATELATPSHNGTPDLNALQQNIDDTRTGLHGLAESLVAIPTSSPSSAGHVGQRQSPIPLATVEQQPGLQEKIQDVSVALQQLGPSIRNLHTRLGAFPGVSKTFQEISNRLDSLESMSFSYVPVNEIEDRFEHVDGRLLDLEGWREDHEKHHEAIDGEQASIREHLAEHGYPAHDEEEMSLESAKRAAEESDRVRNVEERLGDLEAAALPSFAQPWEIEVVFLPWGPELRGIWISSEVASKVPLMVATQETEDWAQRGRSALQGDSAGFVHIDSDGWTFEAIHDWADSAKDWLIPKACGVKSVVYHRLQSRGLVRKVTLTSPGARETQAAIVDAFRHSMDVVLTPDEEAADDVTEVQRHMATYLGLDAPLIPLRKIRKNSALRFLTPSEMVTQALWTPGFLASGVLMRAAGGVKRLFVTHRAAYLQRSSDDLAAWTWQKLRALPRISTAIPSTASGQVHEADAKETCWEYHPNLDVLPSNMSSFSSATNQAPDHETTAAHQSHQTSQAVSGAKNPSSFLPGQKQGQATLISPLSQVTATRRSGKHTRNRTLSAPITNSSPTSPTMRMSKRGIASFEHTFPSDHFVTHLQLSPNGRLKKRPRVSDTSGEPRQSHGRNNRQADSGPSNSNPEDWQGTSHRSKPPFVSTGAMGRGPGIESSSRVSILAGVTRLVADVRGVTPVAYPTPYSHVFDREALHLFGGDTEVESCDEDDGEGKKGVGMEEEEDWTGFQEDEDVDVDLESARMKLALEDGNGDDDNVDVIEDEEGNVTSCGGAGSDSDGLYAE